LNVERTAETTHCNQCALNDSVAVLSGVPYRRAPKGGGGCRVAKSKFKNSQIL